MFVGILSIVSAILLSIISAVFSIRGLITIFSGAALSVGIMGGVFEIAKISATVWLYNFWKNSNPLMKVYFFASIIILIGISSLGIFGFLTKSYIGQEVTVTRYDTQIEQIQRRINREERDIERANEQLEILDESIERYLNLDIITRGLDARKEQEEERDILRQRINESENTIAEYEEQLFKLRNERSIEEVNVGPIKYLAAILYGEDNARDNYDRAARWLIVLFVIVFDPFAVLLMVSGNIAIQKPKTKVNIRKLKPLSYEPLDDEKLDEEDEEENIANLKSTVEPTSVKFSQEELDSLFPNDEKMKEENEAINEEEEEISYVDADQEYDNNKKQNDEPPRLHRKKRRKKS